MRYSLENYISCSFNLFYKFRNVKAVGKRSWFSYCCLGFSSLSEGPTNVVISGPVSLEIGETATFTCSAECIPSCSFTWTLYGKTVTGSSIDITVNSHISKEFISCQAENTVTRMTATVNETLSVSGRLLLSRFQCSLTAARSFSLHAFLFRSSLVWMLRHSAVLCAYTHFLLMILSVFLYIYICSSTVSCQLWWIYMTWPGRYSLPLLQQVPTSLLCMSNVLGFIYTRLISLSLMIYSYVVQYVLLLNKWCIVILLITKS